MSGGFFLLKRRWVRWDEFTVPYLTEVICVLCACLLLLFVVGSGGGG